MEARSWEDSTVYCCETLALTNASTRTRGKRRGRSGTMTPIAMSRGRARVPAGRKNGAILNACGRYSGRQSWF